MEGVDGRLGPLAGLPELVDVLARLGAPEGPAQLLELLRRHVQATAAAVSINGAVTTVGDRSSGAPSLEPFVAGPLAESVSSSWVEPGTGRRHALCVQAAGGSRVALARIGAPFTPHERSTVEATALLFHLTASSIAAIEEVRSRNELLGVLREVEHSISSQHSLAATLQCVCDGARRLLGKVMTGIALIRDDEVAIVAGSPSGDPSPVAFPLAIPDPGVLLRWIRSREVVEIADYAAEQDPDPFVLALGTRGMLVASIRQGDEAFGCIVVATVDPARRFTPDHRDALRMLAEHAAFAIEAARAREHVARSVAELERRAVTDDLTGLLNRRGLFAAIGSALEPSAGARTDLSALFIDLDRFKFVNDLHGHHVADEVLVEAGRRLREVSGDAIVGRLAGDEFVVLLPGDAAACDERAAAIRQALELPFDADGVRVHLGASVGIARLNGHRSASQLLMDADLAMMEAKQLGRGRTVQYGAGMRASLHHRTSLESSIRSALRHQRFELNLQPIVSLADDSVVMAEALLRWPSLHGSAVQPGSVLGVAADAGLLPLLDFSILECALAQLGDLRRMCQRPNLSIAVNLTPASVSVPDLAGRTLRLLDEAALSPESLTLELVETTAMDAEATIANLEELVDAGVRIALDNFGAGWSSLTRLRRVPLQFLKVDKSFIDGIGVDVAAEAMLHGLIQLAPVVAVDVVAEGVETPAQAQWLKDKGCSLGQGFQFGRPCSLAEFAAMVTAAPLDASLIAAQATTG